VFNTQRVIETSARELQQAAAQFAKQTGRWSALVSDFDRALKEVGDFENWVTVMEWVRTLSLHGRRPSPQASSRTCKRLRLV
jgi:hypothetical protein